MTLSLALAPGIVDVIEGSGGLGEKEEDEEEKEREGVLGLNEHVGVKKIDGQELKRTDMDMDGMEG